MFIGKLENGEVENQELKATENGTGPGPSKTAANGIETHKEGQKSDGAETCNSQASNQSKKSKSSYDKYVFLQMFHTKHMIKLLIIFQISVEQVTSQRAYSHWSR